MVDTVSDQLAIRAAGAVLWRRDAGGRVEVAVVHRPKYDDWSLPKGKLDTGETAPAAAVREVAEETGFSCVLDRFLREVRYWVPGSAGSGTVPKTVEYFSARAGTGCFTPNSEVDALRWLAPAAARELLTHAADTDVLDLFTALDTGLTTLLLVRHAKAGSRESWAGDDDLRPLSASGLRQAEALRGLLPLFGPDRILSAPRLRCVQSVRPLADDLGLRVEHEPMLSEDHYWRDPAMGMARVLSVAGDGGTPLVCSQGGVIPDLVGALAQRDGLPLNRIRSKKGSVWLLSFTPDDDGTGPRLAAAHYLPSALPAPAPRGEVT